MRFIAIWLTVYVAIFIFSLVVGNTTIGDLGDFFSEPGRHISDHIFAIFLVTFATSIAYFLTLFARRWCALNIRMIIPAGIALSCFMLFPLLMYLSRILVRV